MNKRSIFHYLLSIAFTLVILITSVWNLITLFTDFKSKVFLVAIIFFVLLPAVIYLVKKWKIPVWMQALGLFLFALAIRIIWIINVPTVPTSDFQLMYQASVDWVKGDMSFVKTPYFDNWSYQLGYTWFQSALIRIFGEGYGAIKVFHCIVSSLTVLVSYFTARKLFGPNCAVLAGLFTATDIVSVTMCSVLTNQHIAIFLFYIGLFFIACRKNKKAAWSVAGVITALGNTMRPLGVVVVMGVAIYGIFFVDMKNFSEQSTLFISNGFFSKAKMFAKTKLVLIGLFIIAYMGTGFMVNQIFISSGVIDRPLGNKDPLWKFVTGLNVETKGQYSQNDLDYLSGAKTAEERTEFEKGLIKERLSAPGELPDLFKEKFKIMWVNKNYTVNWSVNPVEEGKNVFFGKLTKGQVLSIALGADKAVYTTGLFYALLGAVFFLFSDGSKENGAYLYMLIILLHMGAHLFIEIQPRYRMFALTGLYILASNGLRAYGSVAKDSGW